MTKSKVREGIVEAEWSHCPICDNDYKVVEKEITWKK